MFREQKTLKNNIENFYVSVTDTWTRKYVVEILCLFLKLEILQKFIKFSLLKLILTLQKVVQ